MENLEFKKGTLGEKRRLWGGQSYLEWKKKVEFGDEKNFLREFGDERNSLRGCLP